MKRRMPRFKCVNVHIDKRGKDAEDKRIRSVNRDVGRLRRCCGFRGAED